MDDYENPCACMMGGITAGIAIHKAMRVLKFPVTNISGIPFISSVIFSTVLGDRADLYSAQGERRSSSGILFV